MVSIQRDGRKWVIEISWLSFPQEKQTDKQKKNQISNQEN